MPNLLLTRLDNFIHRPHKRSYKKSYKFSTKTVNYDVLEEKWKLFFRFLDVNKDQCINEDDINEMIDNVVKEFALLGDSRNRVVHALKAWWTVFKLHAGSTRHLSTEQEFVAAVRNQFDADRTALQRLVEEMTTAMFNLLDTDNDGIITRSEYVKMFSAMGVENCSYVGRVFDKLDVDDSGVLEPEEFHSAMQQFFLSGDDENNMAFVFNFPST